MCVCVCVVVVVVVVVVVCVCVAGMGEREGKRVAVCRGVGWVAAECGRRVVRRAQSLPPRTTDCSLAGLRPADAWERQCVTASTLARTPAGAAMAMTPRANFRLRRCCVLIKYRVRVCDLLEAGQARGRLRWKFIFPPR